MQFRQCAADAGVEIGVADKGDAGRQAAGFDGAREGDGVREGNGVREGGGDFDLRGAGSDIDADTTADEGQKPTAEEQDETAEAECDFAIASHGGFSLMRSRWREKPPDGWV